MVAEGGPRCIRRNDISRIRELALSAVPQSVVVADASIDDCPIIYVNPAFERLTGYAADEVVGQNCNILTGPETSAETRRLMREAIAQNRSFHGLTLNYRKDGTTFWNEVTILPIDDDPTSRFFVGVQIDVTERLALEASLREAQKMEALGKLSGGIAHDFNNVLALIMGNAEIIASEAPAGSLMGAAAAVIVEATDSGSSLVTRMLEFARGGPESVESVSINQTLCDVVALLERTMGDTVRLELDLSATVGTALLDKTQFESAIVNLVLNARDSMPGGGAVTLATRRRAKAGTVTGDAAVITISDQGQGMDETTRLRAFEPFFTTKGDGKGTGIGLSTVYRFARHAGGDVQIESVVDEGTTVTLTLPLETTVTAEPGDARAITDARRILIVEDDSSIRRVLAMHLARAGYAVDEAANAAEAIELNRADPSRDLIVSDIRMGPGMSGIELVSNIRAERPDMPMMLVTGFAEELKTLPGHLEGVPILRKPFRTQTLLDSVEHLLGAVPTNPLPGGWPRPEQCN